MLVSTSINLIVIYPLTLFFVQVPAHACPPESCSIYFSLGPFLHSSQSKANKTIKGMWYYVPSALNFPSARFKSSKKQTMQGLSPLIIIANIHNHFKACFPLVFKKRREFVAKKRKT